MTDAGKPTVWDVLEEYADVHDELDDASLLDEEESEDEE